MHFCQSVLQKLEVDLTTPMLKMNKGVQSPSKREFITKGYFTDSCTNTEDDRREVMQVNEFMK